MSVQPKIGLLGLYLELYDDAMPEVRPRIDAFLETIASELCARGLDVVDGPVCRVKNEFQQVIRSFEQAGADAIVTLHLAYSPSLESAEAFAQTRLPVIVLDTTPSFEYGPSTDPEELMYNHGIHGVQDLCNLLIRLRKRFWIEAGHWKESDVLDRIAGAARSAHLATSMRRSRVGRIGEPFAGMGDFAVDQSQLASIGIEIASCDPARLADLMPAADSAEVESELAADCERFAGDALRSEAHVRSVRVGLAVRRWIQDESLSAFSMNFLAFTKASGVPVVPFLEASKAMARGIGYAGEGDVLTAALVGALASVYPDTTFTEMFCPDWRLDRIYLSHMGEMNVNLADAKPTLKEMPFPWTDAEDPVVAVGRFRAGKAVLVDLAPGPGDLFTLIAAPVSMSEVTGPDNMEGSIHGWFAPDMPIADFLADYSAVGGTHHAALVYGDVAPEIVRFGEMMGWRTVVLGGVRNGSGSVRTVS
ncbi:MAG: L-arabinose isomerase family protein [Armatimonadota bacterium]